MGMTCIYEKWVIAAFRICCFTLLQRTISKFARRLHIIWKRGLNRKSEMHNLHELGAVLCNVPDLLQSFHGTDVSVDYFVHHYQEVYGHELPYRQLRFSSAFHLLRDLEEQGLIVLRMVTLRIWVVRSPAAPE